MSSDNANASKNKGEEWVLFCPHCHNTRIKEKNPRSNEACKCNRCKSEMSWVMPKKKLDGSSREEKNRVIKVLKAECPDVATPTEILLDRIDDRLWTIKNILQFYLLLTILGIFAAVIMFLR